VIPLCGIALREPRDSCHEEESLRSSGKIIRGDLSYIPDSVRKKMASVPQRETEAMKYSAN
jgi:hypothetical protein